MHVLILGGTAEARQLAAELDRRPGLRVTTSLAGRVAQPRLPAGEVRIGGFGGAEGLAAWLYEHGADALVDATHPFATIISANAATAARSTGIPLIALRRAGWEATPGDRWHPAADLADAASLLPALGRRIFLTTGRLGLAAFAELDQLHFLVRSVEPPDPPLPRDSEILLDRGPYTVEGERDLLLARTVDVLVTKDSGGPATSAKLTAARQLGLPVVVVRRPPAPQGVLVAQDVSEVLRHLSPGAADTCP
ncbi:cobalt-precorrin-6A reductase [Streptomyces sp. NBC_01465]|uniref:cobalt-precorrin-6A reductase n=1 Tax=Streptomyces sp. NBC_01465 TaxID=2903878 RepID=UPI002E2F3BB6|nr:cobalt-precorrin-6A reductase [Streptomyces sp. NBC_01465]